MHEWLTLEGAARHLGVSPRTLRRWIHAGKLHAELRPGPYGQQYLVPMGQLDAIGLVRDVERAERQSEREALPRVLDDYLARREGPLVEAIQALGEEVRSALRRLEERQEAILAELVEIRRELAAPRDPSGGARGDE